jgi:F0F1-type ATP synthase assembly protein I
MPDIDCGEVMSQKPADWKEITWALALAAQVGGAIAVPVLVALAVGWWIDKRLNTLPLITLLLTLMATIGGPVLAYRWVTTAVASRMASRGQGVKEGEEVKKKEED